MIINKLAVLCLTLILAMAVNAQISGGLSFDDDGLKSFYLAVGQTYNVPEREVIIIRERRIPDEEIPVVFFFANRAHVGREEIVNLRLSGHSWMDISLHYHLSPEIYYIELEGDPGPEYRRVYGHWKHPRKEWSKIHFEDDDIVKMVNLRFVSNHYGIKPDEVIRLRGEHGDFVKVARKINSPEFRSSHKEQDKGDHHQSNDNEKSNGKGKGKKNKKH